MTIQLARGIATSVCAYMLMYRRAGEYNPLDLAIRTVGRLNGMSFARVEQAVDLTS